jgi:Uma2 family endonuclease
MPSVFDSQSGPKEHAMSSALATPALNTIADLVERLGNIPLSRIRLRPPPGTATEADVLAVDRTEDRLCELVEGVLVEKAMGLRESFLAVFIAAMVDRFVRPRNLGLVSGESGTMRLMAGLVRIPDVAFVSWDRIPGRRMPAEPIPDLVPDLAVEVLSQSNTPAEMARKRKEYFAAGVLLVWEVDPESRTVTVYTGPDQFTELTESDTLDGGAVLPGFTLPLRQLFGEMDRQG